MASISNAIEIQDRFSSALNRLNDGLQTSINRFTQLNNLMNNSPNLNLNNGVARLDSGLRDTVSNVNNVNNTLNNTNNILNHIGHNVLNVNNRFGDTNNTIINVINNQNQFNDSINRGNNNANNLLGTIKRVAATYLGINAIKGIFNASDQLAQTTARLGIMNDGLQTTADLQKLIFQSAQNSRASYADTAKVVAKLGILAGDAFNSNAETVAFAEQMNKAFKVGGASMQEQTAGMYQLTQAMAAGKLQGDEFRSIMENAPMLAQAIADFTGKSKGELKEMSREGTITADIIKGALFSASDDINEKFEQMPKTFGDIWTDISNRSLMAFQPILVKLNELANSEQVSQFGNAIINTFVTVGIVLMDVFNAASMVYSFFANNWSIISPIICGIIAALVVYNATMGIAWLTTLKNMVVTVAKTAVDWAETAAIIAMTIAQQGLNAALAMCPITWIIIGIIAIIATIYVVIGVINKVKGTSYSATGFIAGCFTALGATIYNLIAYLWNAFAAFAEFLVNVFRHPIYSIKALFVNLADSVLGCLEGMTAGFDGFATNLANAVISGVNMAIRALNWFIEAANNLPGLNLPTVSEFGGVASITSSIQSARAGLQDWLGDAPDDYWSAPKMDYMNVGNAFQWGYDKGYALQDSVGGMFDNLFNNDPYDYSDMYNDMIDNLGDIADNTGDTAGNTGKMKDSLDITDEDLKYLRDFAEREAINKYTSNSIKIEMNNSNSINSELDLDGIVSKLANKIEEGINMTAEGVYDY